MEIFCSEVLLVAVKSSVVKPQKEIPTVALNLWRNPTTSFEALAVAHELMRNTPPDLVDGQGAMEIRIGNQKVGEALAVPWNDLKARPHWLLPCAFAQADLIRAAFHLERGKLWLPGHGTVGEFPFRPLEQLCSLGPDRRDIHDAFKLSKSSTSYPSFWGHESKFVYTLEQKPNHYISPLSKAKKGRHLRKVQDLWPLAGKVLIAERLRFNTQKLTAVRVSQSVLANGWWSCSPVDKHVTEAGEKALVLWLNSTLGILLLLNNRVEAEGAWMNFKKPVLAKMPVIDLLSVSSDQLKKLASIYDRFCSQELQPFPSMTDDAVRVEIDKGISQALKLPDFSVLRERLAQEPVVCMKRL